jgi:hypothetical protein
MSADRSHRTWLPIGVLGWAAGFHFALGQQARGLFLWIAAVVVIAVASWRAPRSAKA